MDQENRCKNWSYGIDDLGSMIEVQGLRIHYRDSKFEDWEVFSLVFKF